MFLLCFTAAIKLISQPVMVFNLQFGKPCSEEAQSLPEVATRSHGQYLIDSLFLIKYLYFFY